MMDFSCFPLDWWIREVEAAASSRQWVCKKLGRVWHWGPGLTSRPASPLPPFLGGLLFIFHPSGGGGLAALPFSAEKLWGEKERKMERAAKWKFHEKRKTAFSDVNIVPRNRPHTKKISINDLCVLLSIFLFPNNRITENTYTKQNTVIILVAVKLFSMNTYSTGTEQE